MKFFACALETSGRSIGDDIRRRMQSMAINRLLTYRWDTFDGAAVLTGWDEDGGEISIVRHDGWLGVGQARLDNRPEMIRRASSVGLRLGEESDLVIIVRLVAQLGTTIIPELLGDFSYVVWHASSRVVIGASDAFNHAQLYYSQHQGLTLFGSRAEPLSMTNAYDVAYLADLLTIDFTWRDHTVYAGVKQVPVASIVMVRDGRVSATPYWSVAHIEPEHSGKMSEADAIAMCRELLITSVRLRLDPDGHTWSQLSGGIDSSSTVSIAEWLAEQGQIARGLDGTVTFVIGSQTGSDERVFANEVVTRWGVRNEVVVDAPWWADDDDEAVQLPLPDQPSLTIIHAPIDYRFREILRQAKARVLLTGWGSDQLFTGDPMYLSDRLARGHVSHVLGELLHRAALERRSFWKLAYENAIRPFTPKAMQRFVRPPWTVLPNWLRTDTLWRVGVTTKPDPYIGGRLGGKYQRWLALGIADCQRGEEARALGEVVSVRHPFLYRPLVEFALTLPPELCARPHEHKWVLRQAMKGIVPEVIRTRVLKGGGGDSLARMFIHQGALLKQLARDPILADLGLVDARRLQAAVEESSNRQTWRESNWGEIVKTLTIEAWLQVRSGRWPHGFAMPQALSVPRQDTHQLTATQRRSI